MHYFPPASELQFLVGKQVSQIALDPHSVQFRWDGGGQITAQWDLEHVDQDGSVHRYDCVAHTAPPLALHRLLNASVSMIDVQPLCLTLEFDGGQLLRLFTEVGNYECGLIQFTENLADGWIVY